jgi:competence protein ComGC
MRRNREQLRISAGRQAFTLVEMLIVCTIIVMLVALTLFAVSKTALSAKIAKTRTTVQKIDTAMQQIFETYEGKFAVIKKRIATDDETKDLLKETQQKIAAHFTRDLMRMEMPQNAAEVHTEPIQMTIGTEKYAVEKSPLLDYYRSATDGKVPSSAELLFLIIQNLSPETLEAFQSSEIADTNDNGLLEFVDAWGRPIQFLRWAPAFSDSDLQQNVLALCEPKYVPQRDIAVNRNWWETNINGSLRTAMKKARDKHPDLLDERQDAPPGWFLYPLIYSAGPDGKYGIDDGGNALFPPNGRDGILDPFAFPYGMPNGSSHFDNIHNHQWYRSF